MLNHLCAATRSVATERPVACIMPSSKNTSVPALPPSAALSKSAISKRAMSASPFSRDHPPPRVPCPLFASTAMIDRNFESRLKWRDESLVKDAICDDPANCSLTQENAVAPHFLLCQQRLGNRAGW